MKKKLELISESFTPTQQRLATSEFERALAKIERETIGVNWNRRQSDMLDILGAWEIADPEHTAEDRPTVTVFEETFEDELGVTKPAIQSDISGLMSAGLLDKVLKENSKKSKLVILTDDGFAKWSAYSNERVALIVALNSQILNAGATPKSWRAKVSKWMTYLSGAPSKAAMIGLIFLTLSITGGAVKANPYVSADLIMLNENIGFLESDLVGSVTASAPNTDVIMIGGREELFDKLLPKSHGLGDTNILASGSLAVATPFFTTSDRATALQGGSLNYLIGLEWSDVFNQFNSDREVISTSGTGSLNVIEIADREALFEKLLPKDHMSMRPLVYVSF